MFLQLFKLTNTFLTYPDSKDLRYDMSVQCVYYCHLWAPYNRHNSQGACANKQPLDAGGRYLHVVILLKPLNRSVTLRGRLQRNEIQNQSKFKRKKKTRNYYDNTLNQHNCFFSFCSKGFYKSTV